MTGIRWLGLLVVLGGLFGACAGTPANPGALEAEGRKRIPVYGVTAVGEKREMDRYELWVKETRDAGRVAHFCIVPKVSHAGYQWELKVYVDERETWSYQTGVLGVRTGMKTGMDCVTSPVLPEGRLSAVTSFLVWQ